MNQVKKTLYGNAIARKVVSWILVLAMILGLAPANFGIVAEAAAPTVRIYFEKPETWTTPVINVWDPSAVTTGGEQVAIPAWGDQEKPSLLEDETNGLYYVDVQSSSWTGFQFVDAETGTNFSFDDAGLLQAFNGFTADTTVYYLSKGTDTYNWYTDVEGNTELEIQTVELKEEFYVVGGIVSTGWDQTASTTQLSKNEDGTYSVVLKAVAAGSYEFKVLQDPQNFAWKYAWGGTGSGGNYVLTLEKMSDVTITIDPADETKQITTTAVEVDEEIATLKSPVYGEDGTITFNYVGNAGQTIIVKGSFNGWKNVAMEERATKTEGTSIYSATVSDITKAGIYEYGIASLDEEGAQADWYGDPLNTCKYGSNAAVVCNVNVSEVGVATIYAPEAAGYKVYYKNTADEVSGAVPEYAIVLGETVDAETAEAAGYKAVAMEKAGNFSGEMYSVKIADGMGTYEYFMADGDGKIVGDPYNFEADTTSAVKTFEVTNFDEELAKLASPVVNEDRSVTFNYLDTSSTEDLAVSVAGSFNGWGAAVGVDVMTVANEEKGIYSKTIEGFTPGAYSYKLVIGAEGWQVDALATLSDAEGNSAFVVPGVALKESLQVEKNQTLTLPTKANLFTAGVLTPEDTDVTFALKDETAEGVTLEDGVLSVTDAYAETAVALTMTNGTYTEEISVEVVEKMFKYTIHYYATDVEYDETDLWIWEAGGKAYNTGYVFNGEAVTDEVGRTWATAEYSYPTDAINIIARSKGAWTWKDETRTASIPEGQDSIELWILKGNPYVFTEWVEKFQEPEKRYILIEYDRPEKDYDTWNVYTWNSGANASLNKSNYFTEIDGKQVAVIEIGEKTESIGFLIRKGEPADGEDWIKDVEGDRSISAPLDQKVVKVKATQGSLVLETVPYNTGCELQVNDHKMAYYYRDDELFMNGTLDELKSVEVEVDGEKHAMTYNAQNERYEYVVENPEEKTYKYRFFATDSEDNVKETIDLFNDKTTEDGTKSIIEYKDMDVKVTATVNAAIDYNENAVLSVKAEVVGEEAQQQVSPDTPSAALEVTECYADLTALGGKAKTPIETALMEVSIAVNKNVTAGEKTIPVTVVDQYGKRHTGTATVTVKTRTTVDGDFDWDEAVIYFMVTDRFNDGNEENNDAYGVGDYNVGENGNSSYHGGDFAGVTAKLDYLKELGINTIWITPIVENIIEDQHATSTTDGYDMATYGYHGYWASSFEKLNKHLGTIEEFHTLIDEAHERDIKIMVDVVANHAGYGTKESEEFSGMFRDKDVSGHDVLGSLSELPDFATERADVREKLVQWQTNWVSEIAVTDKGNTIDYFRVDTVKHVESTTWAALKNSLTKVAPTFKMIGEYAGAGYVDDFGYLNSGKMDSLLDFGFNDMALKFVKGELDSIEKELEARNATISNTGTLGSFLGSHDEDGFKYTLMQSGYTEEEAQNLTNIAASLQITAKGQPVIYYGEEVGLSGANNWPYQTNRYDMQFKDLSSSQEATLTHYKKLLKARADYSEIFARGTRTKVAGSNEDGYIVFKRSSVDGDVTQDIYVALNTTGTDKKVKINLGTGKVTSAVSDVYSGRTVSVANNAMEITIPGIGEGGTAIIPVTTKAVTVTPSKTPAVTTYAIKYVMNKGTNNKSNPETYSTKDVKLKNPTRKGYTFSGWYTDSKFKNKVTTIKASTKANITVYAKWTKVKAPGKVTVKSVKNVKGKKLKVTLKKKVSGAKGYEITYSTDKKFKKSVKTTTSTKTTKTITKLKKNKTYYVKVRAYKVDSAKQKVYGKYSKVVKVKITK
ncbi:MAG: InlB B-repeat-containing protein [Lachnospiraceae bacterium]|nr:InlB B-repeat-containing protein [Lachnospiraceae bacterium]